jgi:hypothetical protein
MTTKSAKLKCVVFSQFFGVMDVAAEELTVQGIGFLGIDDDMKQYRIEPTLSWSFHPIQMQGVLLLSMRCGAFGLTLTAADHCFIMDIAQYSAIEEQAIDRIHRIGQLNPVTEKLHKSVGSMSSSWRSEISGYQLFLDGSVLSTVPALWRRGNSADLRKVHALHIILAIAQARASSASICSKNSLDVRVDIYQLNYQWKKVPVPPFNPCFPSCIDSKSKGKGTCTN